MKKLKITFIRKLKILLWILGLISGLMTIDSWIQDRYFQEVQQMKIEQRYYIYGDIVIDKTVTSKVKELD